MKILHIGNLANNSFKLAGFQRKLGHEAYLELYEYQLHNMDNPALEEKDLDVKKCPWIFVNPPSLPNTFWNRFNVVSRTLRVIKRLKEKILKIKDYDIVHAQCGQPIYAQFYAKNKLVSHCLGSDLRDIAFRKTLEGYLLRRAYKNSLAIFYNNIDHGKYLERLNLKGFFLPNPVDLDKFSNNNENNIKFDDSDFVIFHPVRHDWSNNYAGMDSKKGNNKLIKAFARFTKNIPKAKLILLNSGPDLLLSKKLIDKLGIKDNVMFIDRLDKDSLINFIQSVDLVADQFNIGAFGGVALDTMACGKPLLTYLDWQESDKCYAERPPILNASTSDEIYNILIKSTKNSLRELGNSSKEWIARYHDWKHVTQTSLNIYEQNLYRRK